MRKQHKEIHREKQTPVIRYTAQYTVPSSDELLNFLLKKVHMSRNSVKKLLSDHKVLVNGKMISQFNYPLAKDDEVKIAKNPVHDHIRKEKKEKNDQAIPFSSLIIYQDDHYIAINKPAGLLSVESDKDRNSAYALCAQYLQRKGVRSRPYILHRIDKETSGVLVFAKDIKIQSMLRMHWNEDVSKREYIALVEGKLEEKKGTIVNWLRQNENNLVYIAHDHNGKKAVTDYEVIVENDAYSLLRVNISTGRKNQIRVAMAGIHHPVVGDDKYGSGEAGPLGRLGLHASELDFEDPSSRKIIRLKAKAPSSFYEAVKGDVKK